MPPGVHAQCLKSQLLAVRVNVFNLFLMVSVRNGDVPSEHEEDFKVTECWRPHADPQTSHASVRSSMSSIRRAEVPVRKMMSLSFQYNVIECK